MTPVAWTSLIGLAFAYLVIGGVTGRVLNAIFDNDHTDSQLVAGISVVAWPVTLFIAVVMVTTAFFAYVGERIVEFALRRLKQL